MAFTLMAKNVSGMIQFYKFYGDKLSYKFINTKEKVTNFQSYLQENDGTKFVFFNGATNTNLLKSGVSIHFEIESINGRCEIRSHTRFQDDLQISSHIVITNNDMLITLNNAMAKIE